MYQVFSELYFWGESSVLSYIDNSHIIRCSQGGAQPKLFLFHGSYEGKQSEKALAPANETFKVAV